jgi:spore germination cell wall hydrolase CwlJ-like protein
MKGACVCLVVLATVLHNPVEIHTEQPVIEIAPAITSAIAPQEAADKPIIFYLSDSDRDLIERVVAAEARGEAYIGQAAVAEVIFNRAYFWDMTVSEVATAKGQFAKPYQGEITESIKEAVSEIFDKQELSLDGATHFHADYINPYWSKGKEFVTQIGVHRFYK